METMTMTGKAGTKGALCRVSVRPLEVRRVRVGTDIFGAGFGAAIDNPATDVAFPRVRALD
ncbi:hypothetical protein [Ornithinimicrobium cavernae]|uniref:hypothetical protein n=1 Tax=Ornithinimicrobium cavernae TaxID=2666047 RepID=UPI000D695683|nr:hypothetical protein [Ornithinimicrobium cavernae]